MATLELRQAAKQYTDQVILSEVNLSVSSGEFIVIVGPSGCGKSTLLRLIAGLESLSAGDVIINDQLVTQKAAKQRDIAMVFQSYALYPHMTVYNNMAYGLRRRGFDKASIDSKVQKVAEKLALTELLHRKPMALSGGQRQRVAMGRAIVREPALFLFDEPLSNLDAKLRVQMRLLIKQLHRELKTTSIYVTHDHVEAMTLADRLVVLNQGKVEQVGKPLEVYQCPASVFVAGFIGSPSMNFLPAVLSDDGRAVILSEKIKLPLHSDKYRHHAGRSIILGIRPEHIFAKEKAGADRFDIFVDLVEALGPDTLVHGAVEGHSERLTVRLSGKYHNLALGEQLSFGVMPECLHLFDSKSKMRLLPNEE